MSPVQTEAHYLPRVLSLMFCRSEQCVFSSDPAATYAAVVVVILVDCGTPALCTVSPVQSQLCTAPAHSSSDPAQLVGRHGQGETTQ